MGVGCVLAPLAGCRRGLDQAEVEAAPVVEGDGVYQWSGVGFGIDMSMEIHGVSEAMGGEFGGRCERTIAMLEQAFSLYLEDSELSRLNRERELVTPSPLFTDLLGRAHELEVRTLGYYQPAIHGAWQWLQDRDFKITDREAWLKQCEAAKVAFIERGDNGSIRLSHPLTQVSMNAIAQGYLADLVARLLGDAGIEHALLHLGETAAIGGHPAGRRWKLAVMGTGPNADLVGEMELADAGLAVSANEPGRWLIDPVAGGVSAAERVVAVVSKEGATVADAFATAFAVAPQDLWPALMQSLRRGGACQAKVWEENQLAFTG